MTIKVQAYEQERNGATVEVASHTRGDPSERTFQTDKEEVLLGGKATSFTGADKKGRFVLQAHHAKKRGFHYDLRFNVGKGVAISFAAREVPKPGQVTHAILQPDHPIPYMDYEGPLYGYGQGHVQKAADSSIEVHEAGPKKFVYSLHGHRSSQDYMLLKVGEKIWLWRNFTKPEEDVAPYIGKEEYGSVPVSAIPLDDPDVAASVKIDGASGILFLDPGKRPRLYSTRLSTEGGKPIEYTHKFPGLFELRYSGKPLIARVEVYGVDKVSGNATPFSTLGGILNSGVERSRDAQKSLGVELKLAPFSVIRYDGRDMTKSPYAEKLEVLKRLEPMSDRISLPRMAVDPEDKRHLIELVRSGKLKESKEGFVLQRLSRHEQPKKAKFLDLKDVVARGVYPGKGNLAGIGAGGITYSWTPGGKILGRVGTGFTLADRKRMLTHPEEWVGKTLMVEAQGQTSSGALRAPSFQGLHWEKSASLPLRFGLQKLADDFQDAVRKWQKRPSRQENLRGVLTFLRPVVHARSGDYPQVPREIVASELMQAALKGLKKYDPARGTSPKTWAISSMRSANRNVLRMAYPLRVPDRHLQLIGKLRRAQETTDSSEQLAKDLGVSPKIVEKMGREFKGVMVESKEAVQHGLPNQGRAGETWKLLRPELRPGEQKLYDLLNDHPGMPTTKLAKLLHVSPGRVSQQKAAIRERLAEFSR